MGLFDSIGGLLFGSPETEQLKTFDPKLFKYAQTAGLQGFDIARGILQEALKGQGQAFDKAQAQVSDIARSREASILDRETQLVGQNAQNAASAGLFGSTAQSAGNAGIFNQTNRQLAELDAVVGNILSGLGVRSANQKLGLETSLANLAQGQGSFLSGLFQNQAALQAQQPIHQSKSTGLLDITGGLNSLVGDVQSLFGAF